jgi:TRAP-type C4-dicarboxylate transport system substrate-binding protein
MLKSMRIPFAPAVLAAAVALAAPAQAAETIKVTISAGHPIIFPWIKHFHETLIPTIDAELAKTGKYKIEWTEAYGGTLAKLGSELETVEQGVSDMGMVSTILQSAKMPLQNVSLYVPFGPDDIKVVTEAMDDLHQNLPAMRKSWERYNQVYLVGTAIDNYDIMSNFPIKKIEDLNGRKLAGGGPSLTWIRGTGAVGVVANLASFYNDIKTGVYDGTVLFATGGAGAKLYEVAPYYTKVGFGAMYASGVSINKARWDGFPAEVKAAFRAGANAYRTKYLAEQTARAQGAVEAFAKNGGHVSSLDPAERARLAKMIPNPTTDWLKLTAEKKLPGKEVLKAYMDRIRATGFKFARDFDKE